MAGASRTTVFVGREDEVARLYALTREAARGRGGSVLVEGEPGIGKSSLLTAGLADAAVLGCRVLWATCDELDPGVPVQVLLEHPAERPTDNAGSGRPYDQVRTARGIVPTSMEQLSAVVERMCAAAPLVLVLDDLQWADEASLDAWLAMSRLAPRMPLLLVAACRPAPRRPAIARLRAELAASDVAVISLGPLPGRDVEDMVRELVGVPPGPRLRQLTELAAGNPRQVRDVVEVLRRYWLIRLDAGSTAELSPGVAPGTLPAPLAAAVVDRLGFLTDETIQLLRLAALLDTEFSVSELESTAGLPRTTVADGMAEARAAGLLTGPPDAAAFRHPLVRQALRDATPDGLRSALHRHIAEVLASSSAPVERIAQQLLAAPDAVDAWVTDWLATNGPELIRHTPRSAATLLQWALDHLPADDARREPTEVALSTALRRLARFEDLERLTRQALARPRNAGHTARMTWLQAFALMHTAPKEGLNILANPMVGAEVDERWAIRLRSLRALILGVAGRFGDAQPAADESLASARRIGDHVAAGYALYAMAFLASRRDARKAVELTAQALAAAGDDPETTELRLMLLCDQTRTFTRLGLLADADAAMRAAVALADRLSPGGLVQVRLLEAEHSFDLGRWDAALAALEAVDEAPETSYVPVRMHGLAALIAGHRDDRAGARRHLDKLRGRALSETMIGDYGEYLVRAQALTAERSGRPEQALATLARQLGPRPRLDMRLGHYGLPDMVRLALTTGDEPAASAATMAAAMDAEEYPKSDRRAAVAKHCRGLLECDPNRLLDAAEYFRNAVEPLALASVLEDAAAVHGERGETLAGRSAFAESVDTYLRLGAGWDVRRTESRLRRYGIARGRSGPRRRPSTGWDALTPTELTVADLTAQGRTNPDIAAELYMSRRTVQTHVSHILAKLGVRSRDDVAEARARWASGRGA
jgi:DNA-binding CsgD family transcriptional regulator